MSSVYKRPIELPANTEVKVERNTVSVKGPKGELNMQKRSDINITVKDNKVTIEEGENGSTKAFLGLTRALEEVLGVMLV